MYLGSERTVPEDAIAGDLDAADILVREDRLSVPMILVRDPSDGSTFEMVHLEPDGATFAGEDFPPRLVDARMQFGALGLRNDAGISAVFQFPGSEGDRTYIGGRHQGWANRSHPLTVGLIQEYKLRLTLRTSTSYASAVQQSWRAAFDEAAPTAPKPNLEAVYSQGMDLLASVIGIYDGGWSVPFRATVPDGVVDDYSSQMGFTGKALPAAALLLRSALELGDAARQAAAEAVVDFWTTEAMTPSGQPRTWYDISNGEITWRSGPYHGHVRIASEGAVGALAAWRLLPKEGWLGFARRYGDFLVAHQNDDGSIFGEWTTDGQVFEGGDFRNAADHAIPLLVELYNVTAEPSYKTAAFRAGEFSLRTMHKPYSYVGGACDNANVLDKEAGYLALRAFMSLHDLATSEGDDPVRWLEAAAQAATFIETWTYIWAPPLPDDPEVVFPAGRSTVGSSLIATGQSGADNFLAIAVFDFFRLFHLTGDEHFLDFARFLEHSTKQILDWDESLGYKFPGLMNEAVTVGPPRRGHGVQKWLPWLTCAVLEPLVRMKDRYGVLSVDGAERVLI